MRRAAMIAGLGCAISALCGCSLQELVKPQPETVADDVAIDRAMRLSSLTESEQPFHLVLEISPPEHRITDPLPQAPGESDMRARVELFWLNRVTYRIVIRSKTFSQIRIVNGRVVEEHDIGNFYPRWIQNFVDAILDPAPKAAILRKIPGTIPIGENVHACLDTSALANSASADAASSNAALDEQSVARVCFRDSDPRIASGMDFTRYVAFDDFAPFGQQQIARTLINDLPANMLLRGSITRLEPLPQSDYRILKAREFTLPAKQIQTALVSLSTAVSMLETPLSKLPPGKTASSASAAGISTTIYIRTDRTGKVREAYRNSADQFHQQDATVARALTLKFKPLIVRGVPMQMEAPFALP